MDAKPGPEKGRRSIAWDRDPVILDRIAAHVDLVRAGVPRAVICKHQGIDEATYYRDARHAKTLMLRRIGDDAITMRAQADTWYRQLVGDADKEAAKPGLSSPARSAAQANKRAAVDSWVKLWGLALEHHSGVAMNVGVAVGVAVDGQHPDICRARALILGALPGQSGLVGDGPLPGAAPDAGA